MSQINEYPIFLDLENGRIVRDFLSPIEIIPPDLTQGDLVRVKLMGVRPSAISPARPLEYVELPSNVAVGIGVVAAAPEQGNFTLTFDSETTSNLPYNATEDQVEAALTALSTIGANNATVSGPNGGPWRVTWANAGARNTIQSNTADIYPPTTTTVYVSREGTANIKEIQTIVLERELAAYVDNFSNLPGAAVTITKLQNGSANVPDVQRIDLSDPEPYDGTYTLAFNGAKTGALAYNAENTTIQTAIQALATVGANNATVSGFFPRYEVTFDGGLTGNQNAITADATGLIVPIGKYGDLNLSTDGIATLLSNERSAEVTFEIEFPDYPKTYQFGVTVINDLIPSAPSSPTQLPAYYTAAEIDLLLANKANTASPTFTGTPAAPTAAAGTNTTQIATTAFVQAAINAQGEVVLTAVSDQVSDLATGTARLTFRMPFAMTLTSVRASVKEAPTGSTLVIGINENGSSILSTDISIDAGEETSVTAATPPVISDSGLADDAKITIDIDQVGSTNPGKGLVVCLKGNRA